MAQPLMLAIAGDSGSGRSTIAAGVIKILGRRGVTPLRLDDYQRHTRAERRALGLTALDPSASDLGLMLRHLKALRAGEAVSKPIYDHRAGTLGGPETVIAQRLVVAHGLLALASDALAAQFDLAVFLDPDEQMRQRWKLRRDTVERGYSEAEARDAVALEQRDAARFLLPQRARADLVVRFAADTGQGDAPLGAQVVLRDARLPRSLRAALEAADARCPSLALAATGAEAADTLFIDGAIGPAETAVAARLLWPALGAVPALRLWDIGEFVVGRAWRRSDTLALVQLLIARWLVLAARG